MNGGVLKLSSFLKNMERFRREERLDRFDPEFNKSTTPVNVYDIHSVHRYMESMRISRCEYNGFFSTRFLHKRNQNTIHLMLGEILDVYFPGQAVARRIRYHHKPPMLEDHAAFTVAHFGNGILWGSSLMHYSMYLDASLLENYTPQFLKRLAKCLILIRRELKQARDILGLLYFYDLIHEPAERLADQYAHALLDRLPYLRQNTELKPFFEKHGCQGGLPVIYSRIPHLFDRMQTPADMQPVVQSVRKWSGFLSLEQNENRLRVGDFYLTNIFPRLLSEIEMEYAMDALDEDDFSGIGTVRKIREQNAHLRLEVG